MLLGAQAGGLVHDPGRRTRTKGEEDFLAVRLRSGLLPTPLCPAEKLSSYRTTELVTQWGVQEPTQVAVLSKGCWEENAPGIPGASCFVLISMVF